MWETVYFGWFKSRFNRGSIKQRNEEITLEEFVYGEKSNYCRGIINYGRFGRYKHWQIGF